MNRRDACGLGAALLIALAGPASAAGFAPLTLADTGEVCYSWNGGNFSAGSFMKCGPAVVLAQAPVPPPKIVEVVREVPGPVVQQSCAPPPKPIIRPKRKPAVKC